MRVLHFGTLDVTAGGPAMSTYLTLKGLRAAGVDAEIAQFPLAAGGRLRGEDVPVRHVTAPLESKFAFAPKLRSELRKFGDYELYHAQGVWQYPTYAIADVARRAGKPYIISPRGMLYPQDIAKSSTLLKKLSLKLCLRQNLNDAACVHATCDEELRHCRELGVTAPVAVIPNPVEIKGYSCSKKDSVFRLGYLGRLSPRKNVEALIRAFASLGNLVENAELLIIGGGDANYESFLKAEVAKLNLHNVRFTGFLSGEEKDEALASCSVLAMPSEFENLGNVVLEGLVRGIPCIATQGSPWSELKSRQCGWWVEYEQNAITEAVKEAIIIPDLILKDMGRRGRKLMEERYSVEAVAENMKTLYMWVVGLCEKPGFVYEYGASELRGGGRM